MGDDSDEVRRLFALATGLLTLIQRRLNKLESKLQSSAQGGSGVENTMPRHSLKCPKSLEGKVLSEGAVWTRNHRIGGNDDDRMNMAQIVA